MTIWSYSRPYVPSFIGIEHNFSLFFANVHNLELYLFYKSIILLKTYKIRYYMTIYVKIDILHDMGGPRPLRGPKMTLMTFKKLEVVFFVFWEP